MAKKKKSEDLKSDTAELEEVNSQEVKVDIFEGTELEEDPEPVVEEVKVDVGGGSKANSSKGVLLGFHPVTNEPVYK